MTLIAFRSWPLGKAKNTGISSQSIGWICLLVGLSSGATFTSFAKQLSGWFSPLSVLFLGETLVLAFVVASFGLLSVLRELSQLRRSQMVALLVLGFLSTIGLALIFFGLQTTSAANAELFGRSEILFTIAMAVLILRERFQPALLVTGAIMIIGISVVGLRGFSDGLVPRHGDMLILLGSIVFSIVSTIFKKYLAVLRPEIIIFVRCSVSLGCFFVLSPFVSAPFLTELLSMPMGLLPAIIGFGLVSRFLNIFCFYQAIERLPLSTISLLQPLEILGAVLFAHVYLGESLHWYHLVGTGLIVLGVLTMQMISGKSHDTTRALRAKQHIRHHV
jgi:drug/metabolite transporter (DMT)-like permease